MQQLKEDSGLELLDRFCSFREQPELPDVDYSVRARQTLVEAKDGRGLSMATEQAQSPYKHLPRPSATGGAWVGDPLRDDNSCPVRRSICADVRRQVSMY